MTLEEEKKLVAEKLLNLKWAEVKTMMITKWNPQSDRNAWPEIWEKMSKIEIERYESALRQIFIKNNWEEYYKKSWWVLHTAPPEICWKALIKTLHETK